MKNIHDVLDRINDLLTDDGVFVTESHYLIDLIDRLQYDTIYHEHLRYYSIRSLQNLLAQHDLHIIKGKKIPTHGGSIRVYAKRNSSSTAIDTYLINEPTGLDMVAKLTRFADDVVQSKLNLMETLHMAGDSIVGISAPSRASTVINYCRLDKALIHYVVEIDGSLKLNKYMPGTNIPVVTEDVLFNDQPDYAVLFSWHLADELIPKLKSRGYKGKFIMPCERVPTVPLAMRAGSR